MLQFFHRKAHSPKMLICLCLALACAAGCGRHGAVPAGAGPATTAAPATPAPASPPSSSSSSSSSAAPFGLAPKSEPTGCLPARDGYLRARLRGAIDLDLDWHDADMQCDGGPRPDNRGIRAAFAGPLQSDGHRLRLVFGIGGVAERKGGRELPTNVTVIVEGGQQLFSTRGEDKCSVDKLQQQALPSPSPSAGAPAGSLRRYRVVARGFCVGPATTTDGSARLLLNRFDFAGSIVFEDEK